jgi:diguanylate cyclase (GGDEF)-like protein
MTTSLLLNQVADSTAHRDRDELDYAIARMLRQFLAARAIALYRLVEDGAVSRIARRVAVTRDFGEVGPEDTEDTSSLPVLSDRPTWEDCIARNECVQWKQADGACVAAFPIRAERMVVGVLVIEGDAPIVEREADLIHGIMRIAENHLALLDYGERDTLTGLLNRKTFESQFRKLSKRPTPAGAPADAVAEPSWLALLDIDHFKLINDSHGHLYGDEILLLISQLMKRNFRGADQLYRFGGEEFLIVLDRATQNGAQIAFERLRTSVETYPFPQVGRVTISLGYTQIVPQDVPTTCVERADAALYHAKNNGRNLVRYYEGLIGSGDLTAKAESQDIELF